MLKFIKEHDTLFQNFFFIVANGTIFSKKVIWMDDKIFLPQNVEISSDLMVLHKNSIDISPQHPFLKNLITDQNIMAFYLIYPFWIIEGFRSLIFERVIPHILNDFFELKGDKIFAYADTHTLTEIPNKEKIKIETPFTGKVSFSLDKNTCHLHLYLNFDVLMNYFIVYFYSLAGKTILRSHLLDFSDEDKALEQFSNHFLFLGDLISLDSFFLNIKNNNMSTKNFLRLFLEDKSFLLFFLESFLLLLQKNSNAAKFISFDEANLVEKIFNPLQEESRICDIFGGNRANFLVELEPEFEIIDNVCLLKNFFFENKKIMDYFYGVGTMENSFLRKFVVYVRDEVMSSVRTGECLT